MPSHRIRPRSSIADAELARAATLDLPASHMPRPRTPRGLARTVHARTLDVLQRRHGSESEPLIVLTLSPVMARRR